MALEYQIKPEEFGWLSQIFDSATPISPLTLFSDQKSAFSLKNKTSLINQGIVDADGNLAPEPYSALKILAEATSYTRIQILGVDAPVDKIIYTHEQNRCSVDAGSESLSVTYPPLTETLGYIFSEYTGTSRFVNVNFNTRLSKDAARTFLLVLDVVRQRHLQTLARTKVPLTFSSEDLFSEQGETHTLFHTNRLLEHLIGPSSLDPNALTSNLKVLSDKGLLLQTEAGWLLSENAMMLAMQMLVPEYHFKLTKGDVSENQSVVKSECLVAHFGIHDFLYLDQEEEDILIETMSGSELYLMIMNML